MIFGWLYMAVAVGGLLYIAYQAWVKSPAQTLSEFGDRPLFAAFAWLGFFGVVTFFVQIRSMGALSFDVPMPWGATMKSQRGAP